MNYTSLKDITNEILESKKYRAQIRETTPTTTVDGMNVKYTYSITNLQGQDVCSVCIYITDDMVEPRYKLRDRPNKDKETSSVPLFIILSVFTRNDHRGKYLALLLLIYAISDLKTLETQPTDGEIQLIYNKVQHALLDDCSDSSTILDKNIYHCLGFFPIGEISLDYTNTCVTCKSEDKGRLKLSGPEKQANLENFQQRASDAIIKIVKNQYIDELVQTITTKQVQNITVEQDKVNKVDIVEYLKYSVAKIPNTFTDQSLSILKDEIGGNILTKIGEIKTQQDYITYKYNKDEINKTETDDNTTLLFKDIKDAAKKLGALQKLLQLYLDIEVVDSMETGIGGKKASRKKYRKSRKKSRNRRTRRK